MQGALHQHEGNNQFRKTSVRQRTRKGTQKWPLKRSLWRPCVLQKVFFGIPQGLVFTELREAGSKLCCACLEAAVALNATDTKPSRLAGVDTLERAASSAGARLAGISRSSRLEAALSSWKASLQGETALISTLPGQHETALPARQPSPKPRHRLHARQTRLTFMSTLQWTPSNYPCRSLLSFTVSATAVYRPNSINVLYLRGVSSAHVSSLPEAFPAIPLSSSSEPGAAGCQIFQLFQKMREIHLLLARILTPRPGLRWLAVATVIKDASVNLLA